MIPQSKLASIMVKTGGKKDVQSDIQSEPNSIKVLDLREMIAPLTFLKITQAFREMKARDIMEIIGNDPETKRNLSRILGTSSHDILHVRCKKDFYFIRLKKSGGEGHP